MENADKISTMKRKKKELANVQRELGKLRREEEAVKVPVARLHELLNTQLDDEMNGSVDDTSKITRYASKLFLCVPGVAACHGSNADEEATVNSGVLENQPDDDASVEDDETSRIDRVFDVICS